MGESSFVFVTFFFCSGSFSNNGYDLFILVFLFLRLIINLVCVYFGGLCLSFVYLYMTGFYIIPPIPPPIGGIAGAGFSSFSFTNTHSVVSSIPAIEAAFSRATRVTLAGSITPVSNKFW